MVSVTSEEDGAEPIFHARTALLHKSSTARIKNGPFKIYPLRFA